MTVGILDIGHGNFGSLKRVIEKAGGKADYISSVPRLANCSKLILPGVGHFDSAMQVLKSSILLEPLLMRVLEDKIPFLGICLGMQLLCRNSEEGVEPGLGLIDASVKKFKFRSSLKLKVPHMGWNTVDPLRSNPLLPITLKEERFYFVHSYHVVPDNDTLSICNTNHGGSFCAAFQKDNIFGVQFHPEKSHRFGINLISRFLNF
ncbi:imidazole glycerol phosphate synthase subunit HisH [Synechococcus lacustris]|uniref:imidazole glycerol phosphate synthase subunit HisH n=1 Tax=Synechococcus lacustris TaxID=2116544 RepID=UPI0020CBFEBA|nr:imidazole glycerol phosphate synthase subunit HisH [Synechococcus lacustris]MCP9812222.1 imidazole glycerol phosphate synthase subunit HisH [Synechococcus lacustris Maggiore-St4-Slac]